MCGPCKVCEHGLDAAKTAQRFSDTAEHPIATMAWAHRGLPRAGVKPVGCSGLLAATARREFVPSWCWSRHEVTMALSPASLSKHRPRTVAQAFRRKAPEQPQIADITSTISPQVQESPAPEPASTPAAPSPQTTPADATPAPLLAAADTQTTPAIASLFEVTPQVESTEELPSDVEWSQYTGAPTASVSSGRPQASPAQAPASHLRHTSVMEAGASPAGNPLQPSTSAGGSGPDKQAAGGMLQLLGSVVLAVGLGFLARWYITQRHASQQQQTPSDTTADPSGTAGAANQGTGPGGASAPKQPPWAPVQDTFAPIRAVTDALRPKGLSVQEGDRAATQPGPEAPSSSSQGRASAASQPRDWWRGLQQVHYINFGAAHGILPCVDLDRRPEYDEKGEKLPSIPGLWHRPKPCIVGFEEQSDAEYVAATIKYNMEEQKPQMPGVVSEPVPAPPRLHYTVLPGSPSYLEDLAKIQGCSLGIIPRGLLARSVHLTDVALEELLTAVIKGGTAGMDPLRPSVLQEQQQPQGDAGERAYGPAPPPKALPADEKPPAMAPEPVRQDVDLARLLQRTAAPEQRSTLTRSNFKFEFADFQVPAGRVGTGSDAPDTPTPVVIPTFSPGQASNGNTEPSVVSQDSEPLASNLGASADPTVSAAIAESSRGSSSTPLVETSPSVIDHSSEAVGVPLTAVSQHEASVSEAAAAMPVSDPAAASGSLSPASESSSEAMAATAASPSADGHASEATLEEEPDPLTQLRLLDEEDRRQREAQAAEEERERQLRRETGLSASTSNSKGRSGQSSGGNGSGATASGLDEAAPLQESERQALLSEWYALVGGNAAQPKPPQAARKDQGEGRKVQQMGRGQPTSSMGASTMTQGSSAPLRQQAQQSADDSSRAGSVTGSVTAAKDVVVDVMQPPAQPEVVQGSPSREEEDEYVAAVLRNLEAVTARVREAEAKLQATAARARAGDQAARMAHAAAEAQLEPLREQLKQLEVLEHSLKELAEEEQRGEARASGEGNSRNGPTGIVQEAEFSAVGLNSEPSTFSESSRAQGRQAPPASEGGQAPAGSPPSTPPPLPKPTPLPKPSVIQGPSSGPSGSAPRKSWGAWGANRRIRDADTSLLRKEVVRELSASKTSGTTAAAPVGSAPIPGAAAPSPGTISAASWTSHATPAPADAGASVATGDTGAGQAAVTTPPRQPAQPAKAPVVTSKSPATKGGGRAAGRRRAQQEEAEERVVIVSKQAGTNRPAKKIRTPEERQATVKEALRFAATELNGEDNDPGMARLAASKEPWWKRQFQALWLPSLAYADGSSGFVQLDVSLAEGSKDVRVLAFEDRHDASHCMAVLKQWPEYDWCDMQVQLMPTKQLEQVLTDAFEAQDENRAEGRSPPQGVVVFRKGKLPLRVGMPIEDFTQVVVYQAAAQSSLARVGYDFSD